MNSNGSKGFTLKNKDFILGFWKPLKKRQKSYDLMVNNNKDNIYYKVGIITDIDKLKEIVFND